MDRERVFFDFDDAWIVYSDESLIAVDKPEGIPTQAADPERPDDLVLRLKRHLEQRARERREQGGQQGGQRSDQEGHVYLGTHQRLDRDTSGVIAFTRDRAVNAAIAEQFEGRTVKKRYFACVEGWRAKGRVTLDDELAPGKDGVVSVVPPAPMKVARGGRAPRVGAGGTRVVRGGQRAITHVRVVDRSGSRSLLELELETGRTHQARVQLAHAGSPIAGDVLYGGPPASRLMLHAAALELKHPKTRERLVLETPRPTELDEWLRLGDVGAQVYEDDAALGRALRRALVRRYGLGRGTGARRTTAFRLVNEAGDGLPRLAIDVYGDHLVVQLYGDDGPWASEARRDRLLSAVHALGFDGIYLKVRPKQANTLVDTRRDDLAPKLPVRGAAAPEELVVLEEGIEYLVRLGDGLSTGIFLDQRANRARVRALSSGKAVLNLFAYTCGFSVAAAAGGAKRTVSVDASLAVLERGRRGFEHAGLDLAKHTLVGDDAFSYLARAAQKRERFDLIVLDPPSYSSTKSRRFVAESDYGQLAALALGLLSPSGQMLACTNHRGIRRERFRKILFDATRQAGRSAKQIKDLPDPLDYPAPPGGESHLKSVLVTLA